MRVPARLSSRLLLAGAALLVTSIAAGVTAFVLWKTGTVAETTFWGLWLAVTVAIAVTSVILVAVAILRSCDR